MKRAFKIGDKVKVIKPCNCQWWIGDCEIVYGNNRICTVKSKADSSKDLVIRSSGNYSGNYCSFYSNQIEKIFPSGEAIIKEFLERTSHEFF